MITLTLDEVIRDFDAFAARVRAGETVQVSPPSKQDEILPSFPGGKRPYGLAKGLFTIPDDFDDPLPDGIQAYFEGRGED